MRNSGRGTAPPVAQSSSTTASQKGRSNWKKSFSGTSRREFGTHPVNSFQARVIHLRLVRLPSEAGMSPVSLLLARLRYSSLLQVAQAFRYGARQTVGTQLQAEEID